jgi:hypothetical protein
LVAIFTTLIAGLEGLAPALTIVVVVVEVAGDEFVVVLPDEITLTVFTEVVGALPLAVVDETLPEPNEPPPELDANAKAGAALLVGAVVDTTALEKLGAVIAGMTTGDMLLAVVCGPIGYRWPTGQPVITS